jgi:hypothetical protein
MGNFGPRTIVVWKPCSLSNAKIKKFQKILQFFNTLELHG